MSSQKPEAPGPAWLSQLAEGTTVRVKTKAGADIAIKNADGTWSTPSAAAPITAAQLWDQASSIAVLKPQSATTDPLHVVA